jgi:hypothetical protein
MMGFWSAEYGVIVIVYKLNVKIGLSNPGPDTP